jgi:predicted transcriptional regulator
MRNEQGKFIGFASPRYTQVPDELFDDLLPDLTGAELKVLMYVIRRTFGFKRDSDHISLSQMVQGITRKDGSILDRGTGLTKESVIKAARSLVDKGILVRTRVTSVDKGFESTEYSLKIAQFSPMSEKLTRELVEQTRQALVKSSDIQETAKQDTDITFERDIHRPLNDEQQALVGEILAVCGDEHSRRFYESVVRTLSRANIWAVLSEVKDIAATGKLKTTRGACFTSLVKMNRQLSRSLGPMATFNSKEYGQL